jgi:3-hydroxyisobutyrate dehydrogenase
MAGETSLSTIALIGLGNMGGPMASHLARAGHQVIGFDLANEAREAAAKDGVAIAPSVEESVKAADVVITMLPSGDPVIKVWSEALQMANHDALFIDCSTIDVADARIAHGLAAQNGVESLDAPVSGGVAAAKSGTLTFMVGGTETAFARGKPVLERMGKRVVHCGGSGSGQAAKVCNNMILGVSMIAVSEAFVLAEKLGLSHQALFDVVSVSSGQCWALTSYCPVPGPVPASPANHDYQPGFSAALMLKDLRLARDAADNAGVEAVLGGQAAQIYQSFAQTGRGSADFSDVINFIRAQSRDQMMEPKPGS